VLTLRFAGSPDAPKLVGELLAVIVYAKLIPAIPDAVEELVMTGA
jgi:hypothetical protein